VFSYLSNQLSWESWSSTSWLNFYKSHANQRKRREWVQNLKEEPTKLGERREKSGAEAVEKWLWIASFTISSIDLVLYTMIG